MKSEIKKEGPCKRTLDIRISPEEMAQKFDEVYKDFTKTAQVPGYRAGKAPRDILEKHYAQEASREAIKRSIPQFYQVSLRQHQIRPAGLPKVRNVAFNCSGGLDFVAEVEVRPQVKLKKYKGLKIKQKVRQVTSEDIDNSLKRLQELKAKQQKSDKDTRDVPQSLLSLDDNFAKSFGCENLTQLKEQIKQNLKKQFDYNQQKDLEVQVVNQLLKNNPFSLPETLVRNEAAHLLERLKVNLRTGGKTEKEITEKEDELKQMSQSQAEAEVKLYFILDEIAHKEGIKISQQDIDAELEATAKVLNKDKEKIAESIKQQNRWDEFLLNLRDHKITKFLFDNAEIEKS